MAVNSTDYSALEDAIRATLIAAVGSGASSPYVQDEAIRVYNGDIDLDPESFSAWGKNVHGPRIIISIEGMSDEQLTTEGGRHPRRYWQTLDLGFYLYDESLRGLDKIPEGPESMRGLSGKDNAPGVWKMMSDTRAALTGYVAAINTLGWEGPIFNTFRPVTQRNGKQLWRLGASYEGAVDYSIDTSGLDDLTLIHGDYNREGSSLSPNPDLEDDINL